MPPPATSADPIMSALAQMMSKLTEVSGRLNKVEGAKAQCSDASTDQRDGRRIELPSQPLANPRNLGQASLSRAHNVNQVHIDSAQEEAHDERRKTQCLMGGNPSLSLSFHFFSTFGLVLVFIFTFIFAVCFDVCCCFSISLLGTMERGTSKEEIRLQRNSKNEEKNATDANSR